jgi:hypothetical protein
MKYILLMSGTAPGVEGYHALSKQDIEAHMAVLHRINQDLAESGEFVATQGLAGPKEAKVVRGEKNGLPVTDGIFPESKEFLLVIGSSMFRTRSALMPSRDGFMPHPGICRLRCGSLPSMKPYLDKHTW